MEDTIELKELFLILKKRLWIIITFGILFLGGAGAYSYFMLTPIFQTSTQLIVNTASVNNQITNADIQTSVNLITTYGVILQSQVILEQVRERLGTDWLGNISVGSQNNSQVLLITVRHTDPNMAAAVANTIAAVFEENIGEIMNVVENISVLSPAGVPNFPVEPNPVMNMAIGLVVGMMAGVGLVFVIEYLDTRIKSEEDIEKIIGVPVLGAVPFVTAKDFKKR